MDAGVGEGGLGVREVGGVGWGVLLGEGLSRDGVLVECGRILTSRTVSQTSRQKVPII